MVVVHSVAQQTCDVRAFLLKSMVRLSVNVFASSAHLELAVYAIYRYAVLRHCISSLYAMSDYMCLMCVMRVMCAGSGKTLAYILPVLDALLRTSDAAAAATSAEQVCTVHLGVRHVFHMQFSTRMRCVASLRFRDTC